MLILEKRNKKIYNTVKGMKDKYHGSVFQHAFAGRDISDLHKYKEDKILKMRIRCVKDVITDEWAMWRVDSWCALSLIQFNQLAAV